jgi:hypothetical protein
VEFRKLAKCGVHIRVARGVNLPDYPSSLTDRLCDQKARAERYAAENPGTR